MSMSQVDDEMEFNEGEESVLLETIVEEEFEKETAVLDETEAPAGYESNEITLAGRTFVIEEPKLGTIIQILKVLGGLAVRGEKVAQRSLQAVTRNPSLSNRVVLFGTIAALSESDLVWLGAAVLQFDDIKAGRKWLNSIELELAPLVKAFFLNLSQSQDLRDSISHFFAGLGSVDGLLGGMTL